MTPADEVAVTLLAIDDDPQSLELITEALSQRGLDILTATDPDQGLKLVLRRRPQIVLLDLVMPGISGMQLLERLIDIDPGVDVILMTAHYSTESAVEAIQKGACDYLNKPLCIAALRERIDKLIGDARQRQRTTQLDREILEACRFEDMVGRSPLMLEVFARIRRVAPHYRTALLMGPTGSGKELAARALHRLSPASGPFIACNCTAIVETLFESELFGYVRGAFTGATRDKMGLFEYANGGTLVLDEIGDMPLASQGKLLRVLQNQQIQRVGSPETRKVDVRVIAITSRNLHALMRERQFREDLYYRLSMIEIKLPSLAERREDLPLLQRYFLERLAAQYHKPIRGITRRAQTLLARYSWPGNVRELENVLGDACMRVEGEVIDVRDLPERLRVQPSQTAPEDEALLPLAELDRRHALRVLERVSGNKLRAAQILGISRATLYRLLGEPAAGEQGRVSQARA
jgi:DNA-binding NtrC family response regulator